VISFPFLSSSYFPSQFSRRLYVHRRFDCSPDLFTISGFTAPFLELGYCGPRVVTNHAHTPPLKQQSCQGRLRLLNLSKMRAQSTGNRG
jgi:hypothetical protein